MRIRSLVLTAVVAAAFLLPVTAHAAAAAVEVQTSNFRFCEATIPTPDPIGEQCLPTDSGHVVTIPSGVPVTVTFAYYDHLCDAIVLCPGHNVRSDDGSISGGPLSGTKSDFSVVVTLAPGQMVPFHCSLHSGFGMTGVLAGAA